MRRFSQDFSSSIRPGRRRRRLWASEEQEIDDRVWPGVKVGRCDGNALQDLAASWPVPPQDCCTASISRRRVSGSGKDCSML